MHQAEKEANAKKEDAALQSKLKASQEKIAKLQKDESEAKSNLDTFVKTLKLAQEKEKKAVEESQKYETKKE